MTPQIKEEAESAATTTNRTKQKQAVVVVVLVLLQIKPITGATSELLVLPVQLVKKIARKTGNIRAKHRPKRPKSKTKITEKGPEEPRNKDKDQQRLGRDTDNTANKANKTKVTCADLLKFVCD